MAEFGLSIAINNLISKCFKALKMLIDLPQEVAEVRDELESFQYFIHEEDKVAEAEEDKVAEAEEDNKRSHGIRKRLMKLRKAAYRMEDESMTMRYLRKINLKKILGVQLYSDVKKLIREERDGFEKSFPRGSTSDGSRGNENSTWLKLRMDPFFMKEDEVVGFEEPIQRLTKWLTEGGKERTVISIVGMAGLGKTTLSKQVFDRVKGFDCHALITVSRSYTVEGLLRDLMKELCNDKAEKPPPDLATMNRMSLIKEVINRLRNKRYVVLFDDVWKEKFWDDIESALIDDKNESRILITTRDEKVVEFCKKALSFKVHKLQPLSDAKSLELLFKKAFGYGFDERSPKDYEKVGLDIVRKCGYLPLAIVAIGSLLYRKYETPPEWVLFNQNLSFEMERNSELHSVKKILSLSYDGLPRNLRSCLLYFGMYPEDYEVKCGTLIQLWIAEGFVKQESGRSLEEVARQHLMELISRSLVQVASFTTDGKAKACRVHDLIHEMIREKIKNTGFCHYSDEHNHLGSSDIIRRLTIGRSSNCLSGSMEESQNVRSILIFKKEASSEDFTRPLLAKYMRLKVLDFANAPLEDIPENLGSLIHLKYLSFRGTSITSLPKSISELQNLETLDVRADGEIKVPEEITKLKKLRYLLGKPISSIEVKDSLGSMTSLEKMHVLKIDQMETLLGSLES